MLTLAETITGITVTTFFITVYSMCCMALYHLFKTAE